jgi:hypothetical protein
MTRRSRRSECLSAAEVYAFVAAATALHQACCRPLLRPGGDQYQVLTDLNRHLCLAIKDVTGEDPTWMRMSSASSDPGNR